jgi:hypothetical protein
VAISGAAAARPVLPDYYVVLHPEGLPMTRRHWWLRALPRTVPDQAGELAHG